MANPKSKLPNQYAWLEQELKNPVLAQMRLLHGTLETPGSNDNPEILAWAKELGPKVGIDYKHDAEPWCGITAGIVAKRAGFEPPRICVRASSWDAYGRPVSGPAMLGDFLRFQRPGGGHIGVYVGEDAQCFHVWGGNQSDQVNITRIEKSRLVAARRSPYITVPIGVRQVHLQPNGKISGNEG